MDYNQGLLNLDEPFSEDGYKRWKREIGEKEKAFERKWGIRLHKCSRVLIRGYAQELEGVIELDPKCNLELDISPLLRMGKVEFNPKEIKSFLLLD